MGVYPLLATLWCDEFGITSTEYALLLALVALAAVTAFGGFSTDMQTSANRASTELEDISGIGCSRH